MSHIPQGAFLQLLGLRNSVSIYQLRSVGLQNRYYVVSGEGTRHLMASPEVVGYESYLAMKPATTAFLSHFREQGLLEQADILTILRGGLNYPLEECCYKAGVRVPNMHFISCERKIEDGVITGLSKKVMVLVSGLIGTVGGVILGAVVANLVKWGIPSINGIAVTALCFLAGEAIRKK